MKTTLICNICVIYFLILDIEKNKIRNIIIINKIGFATWGFQIINLTFHETSNNYGYGF